MGLLPPGVHMASWEQLHDRFGNTAHRRRLLEGLKKALISLKAAGCLRVYLDGSFVTSKKKPGDFDACWDETGVDPTKLDPVLLDFSKKRAAQKAKFLGELFPASASANATRGFITYFQQQRDGTPKGIVCIDLAGWKP